jgi:hypothetical protein
MISEADTQALDTFGRLYVEIGILEKLLRNKIPQSIDIQANVRDEPQWLSEITLDAKNRAKINQARIQMRKAGLNDGRLLAEFLPLSFWSWILHRKHYTTLWIPHTHKIMNASEYPLDLRLYREFDQRLYKANQDRNVIAHYNISMISSMEKSMENVKWLQRALGLVKAE